MSRRNVMSKKFRRGERKKRNREKKKSCVVKVKEK